MAAEYAGITLPWTFNRMMLNTSSSGQQGRALNIAKGILGQELLRRALAERGVSAPGERKSHRDEDLFDFHIGVEDGMRRLDLKTVNYYTDYDPVGRAPLSRELIIEHSGYPGPDWRRFFPMLVPHTQIAQDKEAYCFAIASSIDFRQDLHSKRSGYALTAFTFGEPMGFLSSRRLCLERERVGKGFYIACSYKSEDLLNGQKLLLSILGEWEGAVRKQEVPLQPNDGPIKVGPFSCLLSYQISRVAHDRLHGKIEIAIDRNDFREPVYNAARQNQNIPPRDPLVLGRTDFCNLMLPVDYTLLVMGWVTKEEFLRKCREYTGWVWPLDNVNEYENQPWSQITERDRETLRRARFEDCIQERPRLVKAGWMKTNGRGGGACCYVFPNIGARGGVKETNLYILLKDLHPMDELGK